MINTFVIAFHDENIPSLCVCVTSSRIMDTLKAFQLLGIEEWKKSVPALEYTGTRIVC